MNKTYITLVSEQAIPNIQYIKEFRAELDTYLFLSTKWIEGKNLSQNIITVSELQEGSYHIEVVNEESLTDILQSIANALQLPIFAKTEGFIVNLTLGTKIMSIALYEYFKDNAKAELYYTPIRTNKYKSVLNNEIVEQFSTKISIEEYVRSYGIAIKGKATPCFLEEKYVNDFFDLYLGFNDKDSEVLTHLREGEQNDKTLKKDQRYRNKGIKDLSKIEGLSDFLMKINFPSRASLTKSEVKFLTGGWFEEWTYYLIIKHLGLNANEIVLGLNTFIDAENDLDVAFIYKNDIYIIECKTAMSDKELQEKTLYKSGALVGKFGRNAHSFLFTLSNLRDEKTGDIKDSVKLRALQQKIAVADHTHLTTDLPTFLQEIFKK